CRLSPAPARGAAAASGTRPRGGRRACAAARRGHGLATSAAQPCTVACAGHRPGLRAGAAARQRAPPGASGMSHGGFHALLRAARRRRASIVLALALPWCAAAATLAWRLSAGGAAATAATAAVAFLLVFVGAAASARRVTPRWLQHRLDALHPALEDSSGLLAADPSGLAPLARLQRERIARRLPTVADSGVRAHWPRTGLAASLA